MRKLFKTFLLFVFLGWGFQGCGYTLKPSESPLYKSEHIESVYIEPFTNESFRPGVEQLVYNQVLRSMEGKRRLRIASSKESADVILKGSVKNAAFNVARAVPGDILSPSIEFGSLLGSDVPDGRKELHGLRTQYIAADYGSTLASSFALEFSETKVLTRELDRRKGVATKIRGNTIWSGSYSRSKDFPGSNYVGPFGSTSWLINDSEFDRALNDLAELISQDLVEDLFSQF